MSAKRHSSCACSWFSQWERYTGYKDTEAKDGSQEPAEAASSPQSLLGPGPIDNNNIIEDTTADNCQLEKCLREGEHYKLLPEAAWQELQGIYGGGPALPRRVIDDNGEPKAEVYPLSVDVLRSSATGEKLTVHISRAVCPCACHATRMCCHLVVLLVSPSVAPAGPASNRMG